MDRSQQPERWALPVLLATASLAGCSAAPPRSGPGPQAEGREQTTSAAARELSSFVGADAQVRLSRTADLDDDGDLDLVAVIAKPDTAAADATRTLLILTRRPDGRLERAVENARGVLAPNRGGRMPDPLRDLAARPGGFTLSFEGGSRELWSQHYSFQYVPIRGTWLLQEFKSNVLDRHAGTSQQRTLGPRDFGDITAAEFDPDALTAD